MSAAGLNASDHDEDVAKSVLVGASEHLTICLESVPQRPGRPSSQPAIGQG